MVGPCPLHSSWGAVVVDPHPLHLSLEGLGEEYPYHLLVAPCSLTVWEARECPHLRTAAEGLEGDYQQDSGNWMLHHHWLGDGGVIDVSGP